MPHVFKHAYYIILLVIGHHRVLNLDRLSFKSHATVPLQAVRCCALEIGSQVELLAANGDMQCR